MNGMISGPWRRLQVGQVAASGETAISAAADARIADSIWAAWKKMQSSNQSLRAVAE